MYDDIDAVSASSPLQSSVRNAIVESQQVLSKEDFLKLMLPDSLSMEEGRRKVGYFLWLHVFSLSVTLEMVFWYAQNCYTECNIVLYKLSLFYGDDHKSQNIISHENGKCLFDDYL